MVQVFTSNETVVPLGELPDSESQTGNIMVGDGACSVAMVSGSLSSLTWPRSLPQRLLPLLQDPPHYRPQVSQHHLIR